MTDTNLYRSHQTYRAGRSFRLPATVYTYNGLTFGRGQQIVVETTEGLDELPDIRSGDVGAAQTDGLLAGLDLLGGRTITFTLLAAATTGVSVPRLLDQAKKAFAPQRSAGLPLTYQWPGITARQVTCRARKLTTSLVGTRTAGVAKLAVQLVADDPLIYDTSPVPAVGQVGASLAATNGGDWPTTPVVTITGPLTNPVITNVTTGQQVTVNVTLGGGDELVVDMGARTAKVNGTTVRASMAMVPGWWALQPGANTVRVTPTGTGTVTVAYASAWL